MLKTEFEKLAHVEVDSNVYAKIEKQYMESDLDKVSFLKKFGKAGIIDAYKAELAQQKKKLACLARRGFEALHAMDAVTDPKTYTVLDKDVWFAQDAILTLACGALCIDRYLEHHDLRLELSKYIY